MTMVETSLHDITEADAIPRQIEPEHERAPHTRRPRRSRAWLVKLFPVAIVLVVAIAHSINMFHSPGLFDDEGTYDSEAWALLHHGTLSHYTYWYDHPPLGWMTLAGWFLLTLAYPLHLNLFDAGRLFMLTCTVASASLLWILVRRLGGRSWAAAFAVLLFGFTPLGMVWQRETLLDNIATPLLIGSFVLALSPRRRLIAAVGAMSAMAAAILVKETSVVFAPFLVWQVWQGLEPARRRITMCLSATVGLLILALYPTYALIRGELFPGANHVSLTWALWWQLVERKGGGSELVPHSATQQAMVAWLRVDWPLLAGGAVCALLALSVARRRPLAATMLMLVLLPARPGYLPAPYVIGMLWPAAALIGLTADRLVGGYYGRRSKEPSRRAKTFDRAVLLSTIVAVLVAGTLTLGHEVKGDKASWQQSPIDTQEAAYRWVDKNVPHNSMMLVDNAAWLYLITRGFPEHSTLWYPKVDVDPAVTSRLPEGWKSVQYVIDSPVLRDTDAESPIVKAAVDHGQVIATFGTGIDNQIRILRVVSTQGS